MQWNKSLIAFLAILALAFSNTLVAQNKQAQEDEVEIPPPEQVVLRTSDGVRLKCQWYAGVNEKKTIPVILLHDWERDHTDMLPLAEHLQQNAGCAVIVPDLRGHGLSTSVEGVDEEIDYDDFKRAQLESIANDIEACKKHLMKQNNEGLLNIEMLTVVATHRTCIQAVNWAVSDWSWPLAPDGTKQGQDVKSLVLLSPIRKSKSVGMTGALKAPVVSGKGVDMPLTLVLMWGGDDDTTNRECRSIYNSLEKGRVSSDELSEMGNEERWRRQTLFRIPFSTRAVGEELFQANASSKIMTNISLLMQKKFTDRADEFRWQDRSSD